MTAIFYKERKDQAGTVTGCLWSCPEYQVYSERLDLDEPRFRKLVELCLARRQVATKDNKLELWERDQPLI